MNACDDLTGVWADQALRFLRVVFSSSADAAGIRQCQWVGASAHVVKSVSLEGFILAVQSTLRFLAFTAKFPMMHGGTVALDRGAVGSSP